MDSACRKKIIEKFARDYTTDKKIIILFERVRDIPYGDIGSRDPKEVYDNNKGTCSGKHELLKELYEEMGIPVKDFIAMHKFNDLKIKFPEDIKEILNRTQILDPLDPHNFLKIAVGNKWVTIDLTWDKPLKKFGFTVNENWDGKSDMKLCVVPLEIIETSSSLELKKEKIGLLPEKVQKDRKLFLQKMTEWLDKVR